MRAAAACLALVSGITAGCAPMTPPASPAAEVQGTSEVVGPAYTETLPAKPKAIVAAFLVDHTAWNAFAYSHYEETKDFTGPEAAYRRLIDLYCGPDKEHQGIAFGTDPRFDPERTEILEEREDEGRRIVNTRHTKESGFVAVHDFVFVRKAEGWRLDEVYYYDDYGEEWLPSL